MDPSSGAAAFLLGPAMYLHPAGTQPTVPQPDALHGQLAALAQQQQQQQQQVSQILRGNRETRVRARGVEPPCDS